MQNIDKSENEDYVTSRNLENVLNSNTQITQSIEIIGNNRVSYCSSTGRN
jgi:hypothetical protein